MSIKLKSCHFSKSSIFDPNASCDFSFSCHRRWQNWWSSEQHSREVIGGSVTLKDDVKAAGNRGLRAFCIKSTLQSLLIWVEFHGAAAGEERVPAAGIQTEGAGLYLLSLFKGMFHIPSYKVTSYTGHTSPMLFKIHVELVCSGPDSVYIVRGMHWYQSQAQIWQHSFIILPWDWALVFSESFFVHNETLNILIMISWIHFVFFCRDDELRKCFFIGWERKDYFFKAIFHVAYCIFFDVAANCLLSLSSKAYFYIKELFLKRKKMLIWVIVVALSNVVVS